MIRVALQLDKGEIIMWLAKTMVACPYYIQLIPRCGLLTQGRKFKSFSVKRRRPWI